MCILLSTSLTLPQIMNKGFRDMIVIDSHIPGVSKDTAHYLLITVSVSHYAWLGSPV